MLLKEFDYDVFVMVEISGHELLFLQQRSQHHYDGVCKASGIVGGFLYGLCNHWVFASDDPTSPLDLSKRNDLERTETIKLTGRELGILGKICEFPTEPKPLLQTLDFTTLLAKRSVEYERITNANI